MAKVKKIFHLESYLVSFSFLWFTKFVSNKREQVMCLNLKEFIPFFFIFLTANFRQRGEALHVLCQNLQQNL